MLLASSQQNTTIQCPLTNKSRWVHMRHDMIKGLNDNFKLAPLKGIESLKLHSWFVGIPALLQKKFNACKHSYLHTWDCEVATWRTCKMTVFQLFIACNHAHAINCRSLVNHRSWFTTITVWELCVVETKYVYMVCTYFIYSFCLREREFVFTRYHIMSCVQMLCMI